MQPHRYDLTQHLHQGKGHLPSQIPLQKSVARFINVAGYFQASLMLSIDQKKVLYVKHEFVPC